MGQVGEAIRGDDKIAVENRLWEKGIICINLAWFEFRAFADENNII